MGSLSLQPSDGSSFLPPLPPPPPVSAPSTRSSPAEGSPAETIAAPVKSRTSAVPAEGVRIVGEGRTPEGRAVSTSVPSAMTPAMEKVFSEKFQQLQKAAQSPDINFIAKRSRISASITEMRFAKEADRDHWKNVVTRVMTCFLTFILTLGGKVQPFGLTHTSLSQREALHIKEVRQLDDLTAAINAHTKESAASPKSLALEYLLDKHLQMAKAMDTKQLTEKMPGSFHNAVERSDRSLNGPLAKAWLPGLHAVLQPAFTRDLFQSNPILKKDVTGDVQPKLVKVEYELDEIGSIKGIQYMDIEYPGPGELSLTCRFRLDAYGKFEIENMRYSDEQITEDAQGVVLDLLKDEALARPCVLTAKGILRPEEIKKTEMEAVPTLSVPGQSVMDILRGPERRIEIDSDPPQVINRGEDRGEGSMMANTYQFFKALDAEFPSSDPPNVSHLVRNLGILHNQGVIGPMTGKFGKLADGNYVQSGKGQQFTKIGKDTVFSRATSIGPVRDKSNPSIITGYTVGMYELEIPRAALEKSADEVTASDTKGSKSTTKFKFFATQEEAQAYLDRHWDAPPNLVGDRYVASPKAAADQTHSLLVSEALHKKATMKEMLKFAGGSPDLLPDDMLRDFNRTKAMILKSGDESFTSKPPGTNSTEDVLKFVSFLTTHNPRGPETGDIFKENVTCFLSQGATILPLQRAYLLDAPRLGDNNSDFFPVSGKNHHFLVRITPKELEVETVLPVNISDARPGAEDEGKVVRSYVQISKRTIPIDVLQKKYTDIAPEELMGSTTSEEMLEFDSKESALAFISKRTAAFAPKEGESKAAAAVAVVGGSVSEAEAKSASARASAEASESKEEAAVSGDEV